MTTQTTAQIVKISQIIADLEKKLNKVSEVIERMTNEKCEQQRILASQSEHSPNQILSTIFDQTDGTVLGQYLNSLFENIRKNKNGRCHYVMVMVFVLLSNMGQHF